MSQRILVTGTSGQVGSDITRLFEEANIEVVKTSKNDFDFSDTKNIASYLETLGEIDYFINPMAMTNTGLCESEVDLAFKINAYAPLEIAKYCQEKNIPMIQISTDYVFDGDTDSPYKNSDGPRPVNVYGASKLMGEYFVRSYCESSHIFRTSSVYGVNSINGNFVEFMVKKQAAGEDIKVVNDQFMSPTHSLDIARITYDVVQSKNTNYGVHHVTGEGSCSWFEFTKEIFSLMKKDVDVLSCSFRDFPSKIKRPTYSVLENDFKMPKWQDSLKEYLTLKGYIQ